MRRRPFLASLAAAATTAAPTPTKRPPNLVILFADDLGYGDLGCYGSPDVPTPHIDSLARTGVRFTDGYVSCAVCSPSRAALLSGQYQHRFGHEFNSGPPEREAQVGFGLPARVRIAPQFLKAAGYRSKIIGKWHLGVRSGFHPLDRGFDEFFGFLPGANAFVTTRTPGARAIETADGNAAIPTQRVSHHVIYRDRTPVAEDRYLTDAFAADAVEFISRHRARPFFLYLAFNAVHTPLHTTEAYLARFAHIANERHRFLAAMTAAMDHATGQVLAALRQHGLERDTMVVFLSDNGCPEITGAGTNGPLNGEKANYYEGGIRVPFLLSWPGKVPAGLIYQQPVVSRDILPTFLAATGLQPDVPLDGVDLLPFLRGTRTGAPHEALFWRAGKARVVRMGNWKLLELGDRITHLYDLSKDLGERDDVAVRHPQIVRQLRAAYTAWEKEMKPPAWPPRFREFNVNGEPWNWEL